LQVKLINPILL